MFIGPRGVTKTRTRGLFHCPHCNASRAYAHRRVRRFFTLFHVPLVPLKGEREFVQCGFCRRAYAPSVLDAAEADEATTGGEELTAVPRRPEQLTGPAASALLVWEDQGE